MFTLKTIPTRMRPLGALASPPYRCELEYLKSTGAQYYLFAGKSINGIDCWVAPEKTTSSINNAVGIWNNGSRADSITYQSFQSRGFTVCSAGGLGFNGQQIRTGLGNALRHVIVSGTSVTVDDYSATLQIGWRGGGILQDYFALFGCYNTSTDSVDTQSCQIGPCKLYSGQSLVCDLIPVLDWDGNAKMYDRMTQSYPPHYGTFDAGPEIWPVEYIGSTGTEYIDTGILGTPTLRLECDAAFSPSSANNYIGQSFDITLGTLQNRFTFGIFAQSGSWYAGLGDTNSTAFVAADDSRHVFSLDAPSKLFKIDGSTIFTIGFTSWNESPTPIGGLALFGRKLTNSGGVSPFAIMRVWRSKIYDNGVLVRDYKPIRVGSGTTWQGALLDEVNRKVYRNAGMGAFTYGADVIN